MAVLPVESQSKELAFLAVLFVVGSLSAFPILKVLLTASLSWFSEGGKIVEFTGVYGISWHRRSSVIESLRYESRVKYQSKREKGKGRFFDHIVN